MARKRGAAGAPAEGPAEASLGRLRWQLLLVATILPLAVTSLLSRLEVPLGCPGRFVYLYSPVLSLRLVAVVAALPLGGLLALGAWGLGAGVRWKRAASAVLVVVMTAALGCWTYLAPPYPVQQHYFNANSPSHDGAFVQEAVRIEDMVAYVREFPQRALTPPEEMRGTRVVSNPPGMTLLVRGVQYLLYAWPGLAVWVGQPLEGAALTPGLHYAGTVGLATFGALTLLWVAAALPLYAVGRLFLPPPAAAVYALVCVFTPATLVFTPGKDPAQLLTVAVPLWLWLWSWRGGGVIAGLLAGVGFVGALLAGLVHVWIAAVAVVACFLAAWRGGERIGQRAWRTLVPTVLGALAAVAVLYFGCEMNLWATIRAAAQAQAEVTRGPDAMPLAWQVLGVPLFLLFCGPALWALGMWGAAGVNRHDAPAGAEARLGRYLVLGSALVMLGTVGFTNSETPRLWIPFVPLLVLGMMLSQPALRTPDRAGRRLLAVLVFVQLAVSTTQWALMDMRETENRLISERYYGAPGKVAE